MDDRPGVTAPLAAFVADWRPAALDDGVRHEVRRALLDLLGVAIAGSLDPAARLVGALARREGARGDATVLGQDFRTSATWAAFVNGTAAHALDYDDIGVKVVAGGRPSVGVVPAALAVAELVGASGQDLLEALVVGYEVGSRAGAAGAGETGEVYGRGFHGTSVFGVFGAVAASARLLGLDRDQVRTAFGIAASGAKGLRANYGTMTKPLHAGEANRMGVVAALLAQDGFTANPDIFEAPLGWGSAMAGATFAPDELTSSLGEDLVIGHGMSFKPFPTGGSSYGAILGTLALRAEHGLRPEDVDQVTIRAWESIATIAIPWPATAREGKFSLAYNVAAAWVDGGITHGTFTDAKLEELAAYRDRVVIDARPEREPLVIHMRLADGREVSWTEPRYGFRGDRVRDEDLRAKFVDNVCLVHDRARAEAVLALVDRLDELPTVDGLSELLR